MKKRKILDFPAQVLHIYLEKRVPRAAAALSYCLTLSVFPLIICVSSLLGTLNLESSSIVNTLQGFIPASTLDIILDYLKYVSANRSVPLLVGGILLLLMASSSAYRNISVTMVDIQGASLFSGFVNALFSFVFSIIFLLVIYAAIIIVITGRWFWDFLSKHFDVTAFADIWSWFRFVLLFLLLFVLVCLIYRLTTPRAKPRRPIVTGAIFSSVALVPVSVIFSLFIGSSTRYSLVYGSIASLIIMMLWLYLCGTIVMLGSIVNFVKYQKGHEKAELEIKIIEEEQL